MAWALGLAAVAASSAAAAGAFAEKPYFEPLAACNANPMFSDLARFTTERGLAYYNFRSAIANSGYDPDNPRPHPAVTDQITLSKKGSKEKEEREFTQATWRTWNAAEAQFQNSLDTMEYPTPPKTWVGDAADVQRLWPEYLKSYASLATLYKPIDLKVADFLKRHKKSQDLSNDELKEFAGLAGSGDEKLRQFASQLATTCQNNPPQIRKALPIPSLAKATPALANTVHDLAEGEGAYKLQLPDGTVLHSTGVYRDARPTFNFRKADGRVELMNDLQIRDYIVSQRPVRVLSAVPNTTSAAGN